MVWQTIKKKCHLQGKSDQSNDKSKSSCGNNSCKCGDQCKRCGSECKCSTKKIFIRAPMFTYYTDTMH